ncbi:TIGR03576 family pyridoxal phosphate-dependent enzyme [Methanocaldococcus infernus]
MEIDRIRKAQELVLKILHEKGREHLYDLSGLSGGFLIEDEDKDLLNTYIGSSYFSKKVDELGREHLKGERCVAFNRTTSAILSTILTLKPKKVIHYLPELPGHPSIRRASSLVDAQYMEDNNLEILENLDKGDLLVITGTTMDLEVIDLKDFKEAIRIGKEREAIILVDDASGARVRLLYNQPPALELGADLVVTSTDKLMDGPRGGLLAGNDIELVEKIYETGLKYGLEAQPPALAGIYRALQNFSLERLRKVFERAKKINLDKIKWAKRTATGFVIKKVVDDEKRNREILEEAAFYLLKKYGILTITALGSPGASRSLRIDLSSRDAERLSDEKIVDAVYDSLTYALKNGAGDGI